MATIDINDIQEERTGRPALHVVVCGRRWGDRSRMATADTGTSPIESRRANLFPCTCVGPWRASGFDLFSLWLLDFYIWQRTIVCVCDLCDCLLSVSI